MNLHKMLVFSSIILLVLTSASFLYTVIADEECSIDMNLPNNPVTLIVSDGSCSYFQMTFSGFTSTHDLENGTYPGWCAQRTAKISRGVSHGVWLCSSYNIKPIFSSFNYVPWDKINYIINHKDRFENNTTIIQQLIWNITDNVTYSDEVINTYLQDVHTNGSGYCPAAGELIAVLVKSGDNYVNPQRTFFEATVPDKQEDEPVDDDDDDGGVVFGNHPPTADATAGEPYQGFVGEPIEFDGSLSYDVDGWIQSYYWQFGDGQTGTGRTYTHVYDNDGVYSALLTVEDNDGATNGYLTTVEILSANQPPQTPILTGEKQIKKESMTTYSVVAKDNDNDTIRYIIDWGDGTNTSTDFYENNTPVTVTHAWSESNLYLLKVFAEDELGAPSDTKQQFIFVDVTVIFIDDELKGYLIDYGKDGNFNSFHDNETGLETSVGKNNENWYLIDNDQDGEWNYQYHEDVGLVTYQIDEEEFDYALIILVLTAILIIIIITVIYVKRKVILKKF